MRKTYWEVIAKRNPLVCYNSIKDDVGVVDIKVLEESIMVKLYRQQRPSYLKSRVKDLWRLIPIDKKTYNKAKEFDPNDDASSSSCDDSSYEEFDERVEKVMPGYYKRDWKKFDEAQSIKYWQDSTARLNQELEMLKVQDMVGFTPDVGDAYVPKPQKRHIPSKKDYPGMKQWQMDDECIEYFKSIGEYWGLETD